MLSQGYLIKVIVTYFILGAVSEAIGIGMSFFMFIKPFPSWHQWEQKYVSSLFTVNNTDTRTSSKMSNKFYFIAFP